MTTRPPDRDAKIEELLENSDELINRSRMILGTMDLTIARHRTARAAADALVRGRDTLDEQEFDEYPADRTSED